MNSRRIIGLALAVLTLAVFIVPVTAGTSDGSDDPSVYFRPAVRFGTDDRTLFILDFLIPVYRGNKDLLFINAKFTPDNRDGFETNLGIGYRRLLLSDKLVLGANVFYDNRRIDAGGCWEQVGVGAEATAEFNKYLALTTRFNYYFSLTDPKVSGLGVAGGGYIFRDQGIYALSGGLVREAPDGFDGELGVRIPFVSDYVETWVYGGGYHYHGSYVGSIDGWTARIEAIPTDFLRFSYEYRDDNTNHGEHYGEIAVEVPFSIDNLAAGKNPFAGMGDMLKGSRTLKERMVEPVHRDVDVRVVTEGTVGSGESTFVEGIVFVSDDAPAGGDGSFEYPYNNLTDAAGDYRLGDTISIVHVLTGDGTGLAGVSFSQAGITIWGAGANNPAYPNVINFMQGYPLITSTLTMDAQNQTVLGLYFDEPSGYGIVIGANAAGAGLSIFSNIITGSSGYGIYYNGSGDLGAAGSPVVIHNNEIYATGEGYRGGIALLSGGDIHARIYSNDIGPIISNRAAGIEISAEGSFFGDISDNRIEGISSSGGFSESYGILLNVYGDFTGSISNNDVSNISSSNNAYGICMWADGGSTGSITGNGISSVEAGSDGTEYANAYGIFAGAGGDFTGSITGNTITNIVASFGAEYAYASGINGYAGGDFAGSITDNRIANVRADGYYETRTNGIYFYANDDFTGSISDNTVNSVWAVENYEFGFGDAFGILAEARGDFLGSITNNTISDIGAYDGDNAYADGIAVNFNQWRNWGSTGSFYGTISGNTISGISSEDAYNAKVSGIRVYKTYDFSGSISGNTVSSVTANDNAYAGGIVTYVDNNFSGSITNNTISGIAAGDYAWSDGIYVDGPEGFGEFTGDISGNTISGVSSTDYIATGINVGDFGSIAGTITNNSIGVNPLGSGSGGVGIYLDGFLLNEITTAITNNYIEITAGYSAAALYVQLYNGSIGTLSSPLLFTSNSGYVNAPTAYLAYLYTNNPGASSVSIGYNNGANTFSTTGTWGGNYPYAGGSIWASDEGSFIDR